MDVAAAWWHSPCSVGPSKRTSACVQVQQLTVVQQLWTKPGVSLAHVWLPQALAAVHYRGHVHRDIKTENFCLDDQHSNESIYLIDYGFARWSYSGRC